jgi:8-oxo-dGTP pyrophosphatase MutT (NUDIX family)
MDEDTGKPWEILRSEPGPNLILFRTRYDWVRNPRNAKTMKAVILEAPDWVNIIAITPEKKVVIVRQFRFGVAKTTVEIPAGIIDEGETSEQAAIRELREETGYSARSWKYLGWFEGNVAFLNNVCHFWLALDAVKTHSLHLDWGEEISSTEMSLKEIREEIERGNLRNSLTVLALSRVFDLRDPESSLGYNAG